MTKYRKKPVVIDAVQFKDPAFVGGSVPWINEALRDGSMYHQSRDVGPGSIFIKTLEGEMECSDGDWIIRGVKGELYPCKPDIFEQTYDPA